MKVTIIVNGIINDIKWLQEHVSEADLSICADGGANICHQAGKWVCKHDRWLAYVYVKPRTHVSRAIYVFNGVYFGDFY